MGFHVGSVVRVVSEGQSRKALVTCVDAEEVEVIFNDDESEGTVNSAAVRRLEPFEIDPGENAGAEELKLRGNALFALQDYGAALELYEQALGVAVAPVSVGATVLVGMWHGRYALLRAATVCDVQGDTVDVIYDDGAEEDEDGVRRDTVTAVANGEQAQAITQAALQCALCTNAARCALKRRAPAEAITWCQTAHAVNEHITRTLLASAAAAEGGEDGDGDDDDGGDGNGDFALGRSQRVTQTQQRPALLACSERAFALSFLLAKANLRMNRVPQATRSFRHMRALCQPGAGAGEEGEDEDDDASGGRVQVQPTAGQRRDMVCMQQQLGQTKKAVASSNKRLAKEVAHWVGKSMEGQQEEEEHELVTDLRRKQQRQQRQQEEAKRGGSGVLVLAGALLALVLACGAAWWLAFKTEAAHHFAAPGARPHGGGGRGGSGGRSSWTETVELD
jgi:tetratricopeptide (TPR) repeat protein